MLLKFCFFIGCHDLSLREDNEGGTSLNTGVFLDMLGLLSEKSLVRSVHLNNTLGSAYKLTYPEIKNEILDSMLQVFRKQII